MSKAIEGIYEGWKAQHNEETPRSAEQEQAYLDMERYSEANDSDMVFFNKAVAFARASEKAGFEFGFKMAISLMNECGGI